MVGEIYLDNSATTKPYDEVANYIDDINRKAYGNPSSLHIKGIEAEKLIKKAREAIAVSMKVESKEIYFTSGGTESNNLAIRGYLAANPRKGKHIITSQIEHPSVIEVFRHLSENGYIVDFLEVDNNGMINLENLKNSITQDTALISIILVNNETGVIQAIEDIVRIKNSVNKSTVIHIDAVQAYGKIEVLPKKMGVDMVSISSHKIHGPKGVGALYTSKSIRIKPIIFGGGQESLIRSGTENVSGICGFGLATEMIFKTINENENKVQSLKQALLTELKNRVENIRVISTVNSSPYILNIAFENVHAEVLLHHLEEKGIYVSTGSACSSRKNVHSHVLQALKIEPYFIEGAIRFSFSSFNTLEEILKVASEVTNIVPRIKIKKRS